MHLKPDGQWALRTSRLRNAALMHGQSSVQSSARTWIHNNCRDTKKRKKKAGVE